MSDDTKGELPFAHEPGEKKAPLLVDLVVLFFVTLVLLISMSLLSQVLRLGPLGVILTEIVAVFAPAAFWYVARQSQYKRGVSAAERRQAGPFGGRFWGRLAGHLAGLGAGLLVGAGWFYLLARFVEPVCEWIYPMPKAERDGLLQMLVPPSGLRPLPVDLLAFALFPAICEEVLFRGVLLRILRTRLENRDFQAFGGATVLALLGSSLAFGLFHLSPAKFLPTAILGLGFGSVYLLQGSLAASIAMHFINNTLVILLVRRGLQDPPQQLWPYLPLALVCFTLGLLLAKGFSTDRIEAKCNP